MSKEVKIKRGINIKLKGEAEKIFTEAPAAKTVALKPTDFPGIVPKMLVKAGAEVKAGTPLFFDKKNEKVVFTSPVSGEVAEIRRGEKRKILEVVVLADEETRYESFKKADPTTLSREEIKTELLKSGMWPFIRQRPFDVIANPEDTPKSIFISAFDSAPLAADNDFMLHRQEEDFQLGINAIKQLTDGTVHLNVNGKIKANDTFLKAKNVQINKIYGPHPAGNPGVQIHHIDPVNKGEVAWVVSPRDVLMIGRLFKEGRFDARISVAVAGSQVKAPKYYKTVMGASVESLVQQNLNEGAVRFVSGNALTGSRVERNGYLGFYDNLITVLPEGGNEQLFGWLAPGFDKFSISKTFFSWLTPGKEYDLNTNLNGEKRAFVVTGEYEKVFPMDIYPVQLLKAIMIEDIELMENLGIYEVAPEDFALCEYVCTSKINVQSIVREGLDKLKVELS
jgi:Na+-transporting NADH:ubiquinone oxidoreductase subunit A